MLAEKGLERLERLEGLWELRLREETVERLWNDCEERLETLLAEGSVDSDWELAEG